MGIHLNDDGTKSFLVDALDKTDVLTALSKFNIEGVETGDAIFDGFDRVSAVDFTVRSSVEEISFALDSITKMVRPYPKGFAHKRGGP